MSVGVRRRKCGSQAPWSAPAGSQAQSRSSMNRLSTLAPAFVLGCALLAPERVAAAERHFGFSYESAVLDPGVAELAPWTTVRGGREKFYSALDARLGFGVGLARNLEGALYWNIASVSEDILLPGAVLDSRLSSTDFRSLSAQLKYRLSDSVADALGSALLAEGTYGPLQAGFEGRVILDKQLGSLVLAGNLFGGGIEDLYLRRRFFGSFGATVGAGYFVTPSFVPGFEVRSENGFTEQFDHSVL